MKLVDLKDEIDQDITDVTAEDSISPNIVGEKMKYIADFADNPDRTSSTITANATAQVLPSFMNNVSGANGIVYLPEPTAVGQTVYVRANNFISVQGNQALQARIYVALNNPAVNTMPVYGLKTVRFTHIGLGYWHAEYLNELLAITDPTTSALSLSTLNTNYPSGLYPIGFQVLCPSISGGGLCYVRTAAATWASTPLTNVS